MSLVALKRKTGARYGNHTNQNGFSLNGTTRYPSYIGKSSRIVRSSVNQGNICCAYKTNSPDGFKSVKNYNTIHKHGRLTRWYKEDYTIQEWTTALGEAGLSINDYPYPRSGELQKIKNIWVQQSVYGDGSSQVHIHHKKHDTLKKEHDCNKSHEINPIFDEKEQCVKGANGVNGVIIENGIIKHRCIPITKDIGIGKSSDNAMERLKHRRALLNPLGYEKPFPYIQSTPSFRACKENEEQAIDALKNGYFEGANRTTCKLP